MAKLTPEQQRAIDAAAEQASLETAQRVIYELKPALKAALKDIYWDLWKDLFDYLFHARWFRIVSGLIALLSAIGYYIKDHIK